MTSNEFETLYVQHQSAWHALASKLTRNREVAKDVVQSVMCWLCRPGGLEQLQADENPESWIRQKLVWWIKTYIWLSTNTKDQMVTHTRSITDLHNVDGIAAIDEAPSDIETPLERAVREAIGTLDVREQDIICMRVYAQMTMREIGTVLSLPWTVVRNIYHYQAIPKLRLALESVGIEAPPCDDNNWPETTRNETLPSRQVGHVLP